MVFRVHLTEELGTDDGRLEMKGEEEEEKEEDRMVVVMACDVVLVMFVTSLLRPEVEIKPEVVDIDREKLVVVNLVVVC